MTPTVYVLDAVDVALKLQLNSYWQICIVSSALTSCFLLHLMYSLAKQRLSPFIAWNCDNIRLILLSTKYDKKKRSLNQVFIVFFLDNSPQGVQVLICMQPACNAIYASLVASLSLNSSMTTTHDTRLNVYDNYGLYNQKYLCCIDVTKFIYYSCASSMYIWHHTLAC